MSTPLQPTALPEPEPDPDERRSADPLLSLLARGLEFWLRKRCEAVHDLELHLEGSMAQALRGQLQAVRLRARKVVFQDWSLERVDLCSEPIQVRVGGLLRGQSVRLEQPFRVRGKVVLTGEGLSQSLASPAGRPLANHLGERLLGVTPLESVRLLEERLVLRAVTGPGGGLVQVETRVEIGPEGPQVCPLDGRAPLLLPMDEAIRLDRAEVRCGLLELGGEALVRP
jgi:hypothetical protein